MQTILSLLKHLWSFFHSSQIFYSDWLRNSRQSAYIASAFMDGTNITKIRPYQLGWPNGLTIDYSNNRLYWADAFFDRSACCDALVLLLLYYMDVSSSLYQNQLFFPLCLLLTALLSFVLVISNPQETPVVNGL